MTLKRYAPIVFLFLCTFWILWKSNLWGMDKTYFFSDNVTEDLPMQVYFNERLINGEIALWNPYQSGGNPMIGTAQHRLIYPPRVMLTLAFGLPLGNLFEWIFHLCLGIAGVYFMLRSFHFASWPSALGTLSVIFSAEFLETFNITQNVITTLIWVPVCVWTGRRLIQHLDFFRATAFGFCLAMLVYAGHPQYTYYGLHFIFILLLGSAWENRSHLKRHIRKLAYLLIFTMFLAFFLTLPQLLSLRDVFAHSVRTAIPLTSTQITPFAIPTVSEIFKLLYETGKVEMIAWCIPTMGVIGILLAYFLYPHQRGIIASVGLSIVLIIFFIAGWSLFGELFRVYYPLGNSFRFPHRAAFLLLFSFAIGVSFLASIALKEAAEKKSKILSRAFGVAFLLALIIPLTSGEKRLRTQTFLHVQWFIQMFADDFSGYIQGPFRFDTVCHFFLVPCSKMGMIAGKQQLSDYEPSNSYRYFLYTEGIARGKTSRSEKQLWLGESQVSFDSLRDKGASDLLRAASVKWILGDAQLWDGLTSEERLQVQINGWKFMHTSLPSHAVTKKILDAYKGLTGISYSVNASDLKLYYLFESTVDPLPRAYITNKITFSSSPEDSSRKIQGPTFSPTRQTIVESPVQTSFIPSGEDHLKPAIFVVDKAEEVILRTESKGDSFLILNDKFYSGWTCKINGNPTEIYPANVTFRAVRLPKGKNEIHFRYEPKGILFSLTISVLAYILCLVIGFIYARKIWIARHLDK